MLRKGCFSDGEIKEMDRKTEAYRVHVLYLESYYPREDILTGESVALMNILGNLKQGTYNHFYGNL